MNNPKLIEIFTEELLNLHRGQGMDLYWRDSLTCPSEADYLEMVGNKTGGLFRLAIKLMQAESKTDMYVVLTSSPLSTPIFTPTDSHSQRLHSPRLNNRPTVPNPRRPSKPLAHIRLHNPQRPLRRPHRGQIQLPRHPRHKSRSKQPDSHQHPQAKNYG